MYRNYILPFRNQATGRQKCETFFFRNNFYKELSVLARANAARPPLYLPFPRAASAVSTGGARALLISSKCEVSKTVPSVLSVSLSLFSILPPFPYLSFSFTAASRDQEKIQEKSRGIFKFRRFCRRVSHGFLLYPSISRFSHTLLRFFFGLNLC